MTLQQGGADDQNIVDLRTDFVSRPTVAMMEAMVEAARKAPAYGMREDKDQRELEALIADLLGLEDSLFFPTCTMANQAALMLHCRRGEVVLADRQTHICGVEASATAAISGVVVQQFDTVRGHLSAEKVASVLNVGRTEAQMAVGLLWEENTHNVAGGTVQPLSEFDELVGVADRYKLPIHVDGARLWNAAAFLKVTPARVVQGAASVAVSLNKALGAPLGAALAGTKAHIQEAVRLRNMMGGAWRPVGVLAAAAVVAFRTQRERIVEDHVRASLLANELIKFDWIEIDLGRVETNIVLARAPGWNRDELIASLGKYGVLVTPHGQDKIRMVLHAGVEDSSISFVLKAFEQLSLWRANKNSRR